MDIRIAAALITGGLGLLGTWYTVHKGTKTKETKRTDAISQSNSRQGFTINVHEASQTNTVRAASPVILIGAIVLLLACALLLLWPRAQGGPHTSAPEASTSAPEASTSAPEASTSNASTVASESSASTTGTATSETSASEDISVEPPSSDTSDSASSTFNAVQTFLNAYFASVAEHRTDRDTSVLSNYIQFPIHFFGYSSASPETVGKEIWSSQPKKRHFEPAVVSQVCREAGNRVEVTASIYYYPVEGMKGKEGFSYVRYELRKSVTGQPFRITSVVTAKGCS